MLRPSSSGAALFIAAVGLIFSPGLVTGDGGQDEVRHKLEAGEVIISVEEVAGASGKRGEAVGVVPAPPGIVWQVVTDINNFKYFMPRTLNSMAVAADQIPVILQKKPGSVEEVERLLGPVPADPAAERVPGGKYTCYLYSHLNFPWPCSNRWYIIKLLQDETRAAQNSYHCSWSLVIGNLRENLGEWLLEPFGANRTKVTYRILADPGGSIPGFIADRGTCVSMTQIITAVRERAVKLGGRR